MQNCIVAEKSTDGNACFLVGATRRVALGSAVDHFKEKQGDPPHGDRQTMSARIGGQVVLPGRPYVGG